MHLDFHKNISQHLFSAFANKKIIIFYIIKIFLFVYVTLKTRVLPAENSAFSHHRKNT